MNRVVVSAVYLVIVGWLFGCPDRSEENKVRLGVDATLKDLRIAEYLQAAYEDESKEPTRLVYADTDALNKMVLAGEVDMALVLSEVTMEALEKEGAAIRSGVYAHEELVFIGPFEDRLGRRKAGSGTLVLQAISRTNYRYLKAKKGSVERARHDLLHKRGGDPQEAGSYFETKNEGFEHYKQVVSSTAFGLVKRSSLLQGAIEGILPHRIYREGASDLVLRMVLIEVHPAKTRRPRRPGFYDFLLGEKGQKRLEAFGEKRFGVPVYGPGEPEEGEGAVVPNMEARVAQLRSESEETTKEPPPSSP